MNPKDLNSLMRIVGRRDEQLYKAKLGRGVVGRLTVVALGLFSSVGVLAALLGPTSELLLIAAGLMIVGLVICGGILWYGHKYPGAAVLDGAEMLQWKEMEQAAKDPAMVGDDRSLHVTVDPLPPAPELLHKGSRLKVAPPKEKTE